MFMLATRTDSPKVKGPPQGQWTYADWEAIQDDQNIYEIIDGVLYMSTSPSFFHQWIIKRMVTRFGDKIESLGLGYVAFAPIGLFMPGCDPVQPDFVIVLKANEHIIQDRHIRGVPDVIAEVLSPGNFDYDEDVKLPAYERAGVPEFLLIDPRKRLVKHYRLGEDGTYMKPRVFSTGDSFTLDCLPTVPLIVSELFAGSPDTTL
jgi:Uma2 family endonuclease